jgi:hypothetical protein
MSSEDPIASPTLAQLYVTQGHYAHAAKVLDAVLEDEPFNGHALALRTRLEQRKTGRVELERSAAGVRVKYERPRLDDSAVHVLVSAWSMASGRPVPLPMRSVPCKTRRGKTELELPTGPGSACACLAALDPSGALRVLAVADPLTW